jgi:hypothetical protein
MWFYVRSGAMLAVAVALYAAPDVSEKSCAYLMWLFTAVAFAYDEPQPQAPPPILELRLPRPWSAALGAALRT